MANTLILSLDGDSGEDRWTAVDIMLSVPPLLALRSHPRQCQPLARLLSADAQWLQCSLQLSFSPRANKEKVCDLPSRRCLQAHSRPIASSGHRYHHHHHHSLPNPKAVETLLSILSYQEYQRLTAAAMCRFLVSLYFTSPAAALFWWNATHHSCRVSISQWLQRCRSTKATSPLS